MKLDFDKIVVKEVLIEEALRVNETILEFGSNYDKKYFEDKYLDNEKLIIVAYIDSTPVGYIVAYDKFRDGSFYCWMAGVNPKFRKLGVLKELMKYQNEWAKVKGYSKIKIKTRNNRREMLAYLVKNGFLFSEVIPFEDINDNRILLERDI